jgi:hypothetical protein
MSEMGGEILNAQQKRPSSGLRQAHPCRSSLMRLNAYDSDVFSRLLSAYQQDYNQLSTSSKMLGAEGSPVPDIFADSGFAEVSSRFLRIFLGVGQQQTDCIFFSVRSGLFGFSD